MTARARRRKRDQQYLRWQRVRCLVAEVPGDDRQVGHKRCPRQNRKGQREQRTGDCQLTPASKQHERGCGIDLREDSEGARPQEQQRDEPRLDVRGEHAFDQGGNRTHHQGSRRTRMVAAAPTKQVRISSGSPNGRIANGARTSSVGGGAPNPFPPSVTSQIRSLSHAFVAATYRRASNHSESGSLTNTSAHAKPPNQIANQYRRNRIAAESRASLIIGSGVLDDRGGDREHHAARVPSMTTHDLDVVVLGGGGHVGLPLSLTLADAGLRVGIYDTNEATLDRIAAGEMPFLENDADELLSCPRPDRLEFDPAARWWGAPTSSSSAGPVDEFWTIDDDLRADGRSDRAAPPSGVAGDPAQHGLSRHDRVLPPAPKLVDARLMSHLSERIAEGHALEELRSLPQIVGADDERAGNRAEALFRTLVTKTVRTSTKEAELAKLLTNTWRYMKFAVANQFFMIAHQAGVDYTNVLRAICEDYLRAADLPGPGFAAGPCLFKDAMQLAAFTSDHFPMGQAAMQANEGLPAYIVSALERRYGGLQGKTVGILGMAFKAESDDTRASLSYKLRKR